MPKPKKSHSEPIPDDMRCFRVTPRVSVFVRCHLPIGDGDVVAMIEPSGKTRMGTLQIGSPSWFKPWRSPEKDDKKPGRPLRVPHGAWIARAVSSSVKY